MARPLRQVVGQGGADPQESGSSSTRAAEAPHDLSRLATQEELRKADAEIRSLLSSIDHLNLPAAAEFIRNNPPSAEAIAWLPYRAHKLLTSRRASHSARQPRRSAIVEQIRKAGVQRYSEAKEKVPELFAKCSRKQLTDAIAKAKRKKQSP